MVLMLFTNNSLIIQIILPILHYHLFAKQTFKTFRIGDLTLFAYMRHGKELKAFKGNTT